MQRVSHHLLLCATATKAKCCDPALGAQTWNQLKSVVRELNLENTERPEGIVLRSKADCLRVRERGPILLVWPDGIWYATFRLIASKESSNNTSSANNPLKNGFSKEHHSKQPLAPPQAKFDPKSIQQSISERLNLHPREGTLSKRNLKSSRDSKQRNPNNCY